MAAGLHRLTGEEVGAFLARARRLGHDPARLLAGGVTETLTPIPTLEKVRELCQVSPVERRVRQAVFFHPAVAIRSRLGQGVHDRCEAFVFADGTADKADRARLAMHLPFPARMLSVLYRRVAAGEIWDLTVEQQRVGIDERDDLFNVVNVGKLAIEPGGRVIVQGNLLVFGCQHLRHQAAARDAGDYQLGVLPTPHSLDRRVGALDGRAGLRGADGGPGEAGTRPAGAPTMIGFALSEPPGDRMNGTDGADGVRGGDGESARTGGATKTAEITIGRLTGALTLLAAGGRGGNGGDGGAGGDAAQGFRTTAGPVPAGRPGQGGRGGDGGDGGRGGNGGICSNVFVTLPEAMAGQLRVLTHPATGGSGGPAGVPGAAGKHNSGGAVAGSGPIGDPGGPGNPGTHTGAAAQVTVTIR